MEWSRRLVAAEVISSRFVFTMCLRAIVCTVIVVCFQVSKTDMDRLVMQYLVTEGFKVRALKIQIHFAAERKARGIKSD